MVDRSIATRFVTRGNGRKTVDIELCPRSDAHAPRMVTTFNKEYLIPIISYTVNLPLFLGDINCQENRKKKLFMYTLIFILYKNEVFFNFLNLCFTYLVNEKKLRKFK